MRNWQLVRSGVITLVMVTALGGAATAQELTEEQYGQTMGEVRLLVGDVSQFIDNRYWPELGETLDTLFPMFRQIEAFWQGRGNDSALAIAGESIAALQELGRAGIDMNVGAAQTGLGNLRATCGKCHGAHREPDGDGFKIKVGS